MQNEEQQQPFYFWAENLEEYESDNLAYDKEKSENPVIEIKRLNFFIGKNNSGKSRFLRKIFAGRMPVVETIHQGAYTFKNIKQFKEITYQPHNDSCEWLSDAAIYLVSVEYLIENKTMRSLTEINRHAKYPLDKELKEYLQYPEFIYTNNNFIVKLINKIKKEIEQVKSYENIEPDELAEWGGESEANAFNILNEWRTNISLALKEYHSPKKYYTPILRGMRPVQSELPYRNRTKQDYFADIQHIDIENILTGENLYTHIQQQLLGKPKQWQSVRAYEQKLSQYFFSNLEVTLIPELESDMLCIKIGEDEQFPVAQLGDGLQQVIILTYHAFTQQDAVCSFFIEEPELHMHPGMLRQLMNFYLNETKHYYFFTTHSNHLLDMADESNEVMIQKFVKKSPDQFHIYRCGRDRDLLQSLGVRPSSVYLANCTIWVEGITDRLYLAKYLEKYLRELEQSDAETYRRYRRFMPNYHYAFVEYSGGNIVHWYFGEKFVSQNEEKGMNAKAVVSDMLLIADGDNLGKAERVEGWTQELTEQNVYILPCKEIENTLPYDVIISVAKALFNRKRQETQQGFDIEKLDNIDCDDRDNFFFNQEKGIGGILDDVIRKDNTDAKKSLFSDSGVGTIADKLNFCHAVLNEMDNHQDWQLTPSARDLCERIFQHIEKNNDEAQ
ncbi:ATP-binding protein [Conchiformibius steedae]|uniref:AAA family ATPase n=1 Tax=Conchiformibius steedae TaxID=153493 RepID=UPI0026EB5CBE|nr:ATP-binding protein [Conchiformibius steedae]